MKKLKFYTLKHRLLLLIVFGLFILSGEKTYSQGVSVNASGNPPDPSAMIDVSSTNKGGLMPRMTTAQRDSIQSPAVGLIIFNLDCNVLNYNAGTSASPNWATVNASNILVAGVSITANPSGAICAGTGVTFTAVPSSGINSPTYQWQVSGINMGANSATYTSSSLNNGDVVTCILTSNAPCVTGSPATSNSITTTINQPPSAPDSISGNTILCANSAGNVYSVSPVSGATSYNWTVPGDAAITAGSGSTSIIVTFGSDSGNIIVNAVNSCGTSSASSLPVKVIPLHGSQTFNYTGTVQTFTVSGVCNVTSITITAYGAQGGHGGYGNGGVGDGAAPGGLGGEAIGTLAVSPGQILYVVVGGQNMFNGGGTGGPGGDAGGYGTGGNGGDASDVRVGDTTITGRVIIAGGGGGGGGYEYGGYTSGTGGTGGGTSGGTGGNSCCLGTYGQGASGGTQSAGGTYGCSTGGGRCGTSGMSGQGGAGSNTSSADGGGGGGGYYGGGGGGNYGGGGGGGGGSGYIGGVTSGSMQNGVQSGNGQVVITW